MNNKDYHQNNLLKTFSQIFSMLLGTQNMTKSNCRFFFLSRSSSMHNEHKDFSVIVLLSLKTMITLILNLSISCTLKLYCFYSSQQLSTKWSLLFQIFICSPLSFPLYVSYMCCTCSTIFGQSILDFFPIVLLFSF